MPKTKKGTKQKEARIAIEREQSNAYGESDGREDNKPNARGFRWISRLSVFAGCGSGAVLEGIL